MRPWLFHLGGVGVPSYWVLFLIGLLAAVYLAWHEARRDGLPAERMLDLSLVVLVAGLLGARLMHVLAEDHPLKPGSPILEYYLEHPSRILDFSSGLAFYGGLLLGGAAGFFYARAGRLPLGKLADILALAVPVGLVFGRLGCFLAGCCHGRPSGLPWAVSYTDPQSLARPLNVPLHPTQLYSALLALVLFVFLLVTKRRFQRFTGQVFLVFVILYSAGRFLIEFLRNDNRGMHFDGYLSSSQVVAIPLMLAAIVVLVFLNRRAGKASPAPAPGG